MAGQELNQQAEEAEAERKLVADGFSEPADQLPRGGGVDEGPMPDPQPHRPGSLLDKIRGLFGRG